MTLIQGNPEEHTIYEFAEMIKKEVGELPVLSNGITTNSGPLGGSSQIVHLPPVQDDPRKRKPDISKAWEHLRWKPMVGI